MQSEGASFADQLIPVSMRTMSGIILYIISQVLYHAVIMIYLTDETLKIRPETAVTFALLQEDDASPEVATSNSDTSLWKASILAELSKQFGESSGLNRLMTGILFLLKSIFHGLKLFKETFSKSTVPGSNLLVNSFVYPMVVSCVSIPLSKCLLDLRTQEDSFLSVQLLTGLAYQFYIENALLTSPIHGVFTWLCKSKSVLSVIFPFPNPTAGWVMLLVHSAIMVGRRLVSPVPFTRKEILVALLVTLILSWRATAALERAYVIAVQEFVQKSSTSLDKRRADFEKWKELYDNKQLGDEDNLFRAEKLAELESFFDPSRPPLDVEALHESEIDFSKKELLYRIQTLEGLLKRELDRKVTGQHQEALRKGSYKREDASTMEQDKVGSVNQTKSAPRNPVDTSRIPRNESSKSRNKRKKSRSNAMTLFGYSGLFLVSLL